MTGPLPPGVRDGRDLLLVVAAAVLLPLAIWVFGWRVVEVHERRAECRARGGVLVSAPGDVWDELRCVAPLAEDGGSR